jgi:general stress protein 26
VHETDNEIEALQQVLDKSYAGAGPHLSNVITPERRLGATELADRLQGMVLLSLATSTADGRPIVGPVDGYFIHGAFYFSSGRDSVRMRHIASRPSVSALHLPGEELAVTVHGNAEIFELMDPQRPDLREAMLEWYLPKQGPSFEDWLTAENPLGARIEAEKIFTFHMDPA